MKKNALFVALGILLSRIAGLIRVRVFAHYFGNSDAGDAFNAAVKIPNFLQNLFGEGVLSASFIPVYANLLAKKHDEEAAKVASIIGSMLFVVTSTLVLIGVLATPILIGLIAPGFTGEKRELTIHLVQILFPGTGFLVMSAWCLGILNSHHKFFLSYAAPVIWNFAIIAALLIFGPRQLQTDLAVSTSYGLFVGSVLQFLIQLPFALRLGRKLRPCLDRRVEGVRTVVKNFIPVVFSRGVVQVSAYIDNVIASLLPTGAVSALAYAQTLYLLPVSLFGMSISVAALPAMAQATGSEEEINTYLRARLNQGLAQIAFFIVPSVIGFLFLGDMIVGAIFQGGAFDKASTQYVWAVLVGYTVGLLASTMARLYSSTFYALRDSRSPLKYAFGRVLFTTILGIVAGLYLPGWLGLDSRWGTTGLTASSGLAGWMEFYFLRRALGRRIGRTGINVNLQIKLWGIAVLSAFVAFVCKLYLNPVWHVIYRAAIVLSIFGIVYLTLGYVSKVEQAREFLDKILRKLRLKK